MTVGGHPCQQPFSARCSKLSGHRAKRKKPWTFHAGGLKPEVLEKGPGGVASLVREEWIWTPPWEGVRLVGLSKGRKKNMDMAAPAFFFWGGFLWFCGFVGWNKFENWQIWRSFKLTFRCEPPWSQDPRCWADDALKRKRAEWERAGLVPSSKSLNKKWCKSMKSWRWTVVLYHAVHPPTLNWVVATQLFFILPRTLGKVNPIWHAQIFQMGLV